MSWKTTLPVVGEKRLIFIDNNVIGNYFSEKETTYAAVETVFEDPEIQIQCGRHTVEESVKQLGRSADMRKALREAVARLQEEGKISISGAASLTPKQRSASQLLQRQLTRSFSVSEASLIAEALSRQVPLLTLESRIASSLKSVFEDKAFQGMLERLGLKQSLEVEKPQPGAQLISYS